MGIAVIIFLSGLAFYYIVLVPYARQLHEQKMKEQLQNFMSEFATKAHELDAENIRMQSNEPPNEEEIDLYYKMYIKKHDLTAQTQWNTAQPMTPEYFKEEALKNGFKWLVANTSDLMIGIPPNTSFVRTTDYKALVLEDEAKKNKGQ